MLLFFSEMVGNGLPTLVSYEAHSLASQCIPLAIYCIGSTFGDSSLSISLKTCSNCFAPNRNNAESSLIAF